MAINKKLIFWKSATFNPPTSSTDTTKDVLWNSIVFFGSTAGTYANSIWTHGQVFSAGTWGTNQTNYVPLTLSGTTYNLSKDGHTHNYLPLTGGTMTSNILFNTTATGIDWSMNSDMASIKFYNTGDGDTDSRLQFTIGDNSNEYFSWRTSAGTELLKLLPSDTTNGLTFRGKNVWHADNSNSASVNWAANTLTANTVTSTRITGVKLANGDIRNNLGDPTVEEMALFHGQFNNKLRFISPTSQEESTDGVTWIASSRATSDQLADMMIGEGQGTGFNAIPTGTIGTYGGYRLTWDVYGQIGYVCFNYLYVYNSTSGNTVTFKIEAYHNTNGWENYASGSISNWPGHTVLKHNAIWYSNSASQYGKIRVTFSTTHNAYTNPFVIYGIEWFGGYPAARRNVESYDRNKNVTFPAAVYGTTFYGNLSGTATSATSAGKWTSARTVTFGAGDVSGSFTIDGSADVSNVNLQVADNSHNHTSLTGVTSFTFAAPSGDPSPTITSRVVPTTQGGANEKSELILFHSNDGANGSGVDQITLRAPGLSFQTYTDSGVSSISADGGYNERLYIAPNGAVTISQTLTVTNGITANLAGNATTATTWQTPRTLTIGATGKSVNGAGDVSWSLTEIGAAESVHTHNYLPLGGGNLTGAITISNQAAINTAVPGTQLYGLHFLGQSTSDYATGITWNGGSTGAQAGIYVQGSGAYGTKMYIATTDTYASGSKTAISIDHTGLVNFERVRPKALGNLILDVGNYNSYALSLGGGTMTSTAKVVNLNADLLDGYHADTTASANTVVRRDSDGYIYGVYINSNRGNETSAAASYIYDTGDGWMRKKTLANTQTEIVTKAAVESVLTGDITSHSHTIPEFIKNKYTYLSDSTNGVFMPMVKGGIYATQTLSVTGSIKIILPSYKSNMMISFYVDIYEFDSDRSVTYRIGGYNYYDAPATWLNTSAYCLQDSDNRNLPVYFYSDTTNSKQYIAIGEISTTWSYPQVVVRDVFGGYATSETDILNEWNISFVTSHTGTLTSTQSGNQVWTDWSRISNIPSSFTPASHDHGNISNGGAIGTTANLPLITTTNGLITTGTFGTTANTFCQGNDSRLSNSRPASTIGGSTWAPSSNILLGQTANDQEWSFDITRNGYTGGYWHVWDSANSTMLKVDAVTGKVSAPYNFVGNLEGNASGLSSVIAENRLVQRLYSYTSQYAVNPNDFKKNGFAYSSVVAQLPSNVSDANILGIFHTDGGWGHQLAFKFNGNGVGGASYDGKDLYTRTYNQSTSTWTSWYNLLSSGNYNSYSPKLDGTGASGSWGIRVTGFANAGSPKLYSTDGTYAYDSANPYYGYLTYNGSANRWRFKVSPATPDAVEVAYADSSGNANTAGYSPNLSFTTYATDKFSVAQTFSDLGPWTGGWATHLIGNHGDGSTYYNQTLTLPFWGAPQYSRKEGGVNKGPFKIWTEENDGSGTGLDADLLDGYHSSSFMRADANATTTGNLQIASGGLANAEIAIGNGSATGTQSLKFRTTGVEGWLQYYQASNIFLFKNSSAGWATVSANTFTSNVATGTSPFTVSSTTLVSNLNADMLDGLNSASTATANTIVARDSNGYIYGVYINSNRGNETSTAASYIYDTGDGWMRKKTLANTQIEIVTKAAIETALTGAITSHTHSYLPLSGGVLTGNIEVTYNSGVTGSSAPSYFQTNVQLITTSNNVPALGFHRSGTSATTLYEYDGELYVNAWVARSQTGKLLSSGNYNSYALPLTGGTMTGALNFKNGTWNNVGDDVALGDIDVAGQLGIKALNSAIPGIAFYNNSAVPIGNLTSNAGTLQWNGSTVWHAGNDGAGTGLDADLLDGYQSTAFLRPYHSNSDFVNGTLVQTNIPSNTTVGASFILEGTGKSYSSTNPPFSFIIQGYLYNNTIINYSGIHFSGYGFNTAKILDNSGYLAFWWPTVTYWNSFQVTVREATSAGTVNNRVTTITDNAEPASSKKVTVTMIKNLSSANYTEYALPKTGGTITGTITATAFYESSDIRLKTNIESIDYKTTDLIFSEDFLKSFTRKDRGYQDYGVIAQHIEKYFPDLVSTSDTGFKHVKYSAVLSMIMGASIKKIKSLEERITNLENK